MPEDRSFPPLLSRSNEDGAKLRSTQVLREETKDIGLQGKDIAEYVTRQQTLDREERAVWRDTQKRQVKIRMAELQAEDRKRADDIRIAETEAHAEDKKRADEIRFAQIEANKELALKELELKAQQDQESTSDPNSS